MLLETGFVVAIYFGVRLFEHRNNARSLGVSEPAAPQYFVGKKRVPQKTDIEPRQLRVNANQQNIEFIKKNEKINHYLKVSLAHLGMATTRQFIYPPIAPLYLGIFLDTR